MIAFLSPLLGFAGPLFKSKWFWIILLIGSLAGFGYWQTTRVINQKHEIENLEQTVEEVQAARTKLLKDIERMNDINQGLENDKRAAQERINILAIRLADAVGKINAASTPEETAAVSVEIVTMTDKSYECIEAVTGKVGASCEQ